MKKIIVIVGQTASGKTDLSIDLAQKHHGEIVSADSRQVYIGMDIGTAKITPDEMRGIPHHMIDIVNPRKTTYTVADYVRDGRKVLYEIWERGNTPIIVGGTGMYIDALLGRITLDGPASDPQLRQELEDLSLSELQNRLRSIDSAIYEQIDQENPRRLVRAIERLELPSADYSDILPLPDTIDIQWIGIEREQSDIWQRIHQRNVHRIENGLIQEVQDLYASGLSWDRMESLGLEYRYVSQYIRGEIASKEELIEVLDIKTRQYAKRQKTWFKRNKEIKWRKQ